MGKRKRDKLKIMISSTVYGNQDILTQTSVILRQKFGYDVVMSLEGSIYVAVEHANNPEAACLQAVNDCDLFLGIIFPRYGSGITHKEFKEAVRINKPRWFLAHEKIGFLRNLFTPYLFDEQENRTNFEIRQNTVLDSIKVVDMYNDVSHNWVQTFHNQGEILYFIEQQFKDYEKRQKELRK